MALFWFRALLQCQGRVGPGHVAMLHAIACARVQCARVLHGTLVAKRVAAPATAWLKGPLREAVALRIVAESDSCGAQLERGPGRARERGGPMVVELLPTGRSPGNCSWFDPESRHIRFGVVDRQLETSIPGGHFEFDREVVLRQAGGCSGNRTS